MIILRLVHFGQGRNTNNYKKNLRIIYYYYTRLITYNVHVPMCELCGNGDTKNHDGN